MLKEATCRENEILEIFAEFPKILCETPQKTLNYITNRVINFFKEGNIFKLSCKNMEGSSLLDV